MEEKDSEKEKTKQSSEPAIKEELKDKKDAKVETSKKVIEEDKKEPLKVENKKEVEPEKEKIVEENNQPEEVEETSKKVPKRRQSVDKQVDNSTIQEVNTGKKINSLRDVTVVLRKFQDKGINSVEDFYTLRNVKVFLGKNYSKTGDRNYLELMDMFGELVKKMPKELKDKVSTR